MGPDFKDHEGKKRIKEEKNKIHGPPADDIIINKIVYYPYIVNMTLKIP